MRDARLLYTAAFLRAFTLGVLGVLLAFHLTASHFDAEHIGHVVSAGLVGIAAGTAVAGFFGDRVGRRRMLQILAVLSASSLAFIAFLPAPMTAVVAAFFGLVNGAGRDRGAHLTLEQALLATTTTPATRTRAFAIYNVCQDGGAALGSAAVALLKMLPAWGMIPLGTVGRAGVVASAVLSAAGLLCYARLSPATDPAVGPRPAPLSSTTRSRLWKLSALFALDSVGGGFLAATFLTIFFHEHFSLGESEIGWLFAGARVLNAVSHVGAAWLSRRIGLVNTMVFTHTPSSLLLVTVALSTSLPVAIVLFLLREGLVEMDVPTRQSYVNGIVADHERTRVNAITNLVRMLAWAAAAEVAGRFLSTGSFWLPLIACACMKVTYDALLWTAFRRTKPPEERIPAAA
jgi:MFS family permease